VDRFAPDKEFAGGFSWGEKWLFAGSKVAFCMFADGFLRLAHS
jgi:hypothetical protein